MKKGKYLITGCAGFIGSHLTEKLYKKYNLILVDDLSEGRKSKLPKKLRKKLINKKIQDIKKINSKNIKGIFHLAAQSSVPVSIKDFYKSSTNNINSTLKVFEIAKNYSIPVVYASSSAIYGNLPTGNDNKKKFQISSPYAQDKLSLEDYAKLCFKIFNISSIGLRFFNVYGSKQNANTPYSAVIPIFINKMKKNLPVTINGGFQTRDFIYIDDVIKILLISMKKVQNKKISDNFNVGTGRSIKISHLYQIIKKRVPNNSKIIRKKLEKFDPKKSSGKLEKIKKNLIGNKFKFTKLEDGIDKTIESN